MRLLLDTHVLLWALADAPQLGKARAMILDPSNEVIVSVTSYLEIAIKVSIGKLAADLEQIRDFVQRSGYRELPLLPPHAITMGKLENHHKEPFDRMLIAQAESEPMFLVTADSAIQAYTVPIIYIGERAR